MTTTRSTMTIVGATLPNEDDDESCRVQLSGIEREIRRRLERPELADDEWFCTVNRELVASECPWALDLRAEILLLIVQWQYAQRRTSDALTTAKRALQLAVAADAPALQRKALSNIAVIHIYSRNLTDATICLVEAFGIANRLGDRVGKCATLANLATARFEAGLLDEAVKLYRYVLELAANDLPLQAIKVEAHHNIALASLILEDLDSAKRHMHLAIGGLFEPTTQFVADQRVVMELSFTKILVRTGDIVGARKRARIADQVAKEKGSSLARIQVELAKSLCDAAEGNTTAALAQLKEIEAQVLPTEPAYRDVLEIELLCNRLAGQDHFSRYYSRRYLAHLAEWQRKTANEQVLLLKRALKNFTTPSEMRGLPIEVAERLIPNRGRHTSVAQEQLETLSILSELREDATGEHCLRVSRLSAMIAVEIGYPSAQVESLERASRLHDIGKLAVPDVILMKRGKLTAAENQIMRRHPTEGCQLLTEILGEVEALRSRESVESLRLAAEIALHHHEWWDGSGYPRKISGDRIPETSRIVAIADAFDELTHVRPYKRALSVRNALSKINELSGKQFDPRLCSEFIKIAERITLDRDPEEGLPSRDDAPPFAAANRIIRRLIHASNY